MFCIFCPNLVALASISGELWHGQTQFDLEGQGHIPHKTIRIITKVFYTSGPNFVILAWTGDELLQGQACWWTDGHTDTGNPEIKSGIGLFNAIEIFFGKMGDNCSRGPFYWQMKFNPSMDK